MSCKKDLSETYYKFTLILLMKKSAILKQQKLSTQTHLTNPSAKQNKHFTSQTKVKAFMGLYDTHKAYNSNDFGEVLASCFTLFKKISARNPDFYKSLLQQIKVQKYVKGQVLALINQPAQTAIFVLQGKAGIYLKGGMSPERAKGYKQQYGEQFHLEVMNATSKRKSNIIQEQNSALDILDRRQKQHKKIFSSEDQIKQWFPMLFKASYLNDLDTIDESALKRSVIRSATIIAQTPMTIVTLDKSVFRQKAFKYDNVNVQTDEKLQNLRNFGLFKAWDTKLNSLMMYFERVKHKRGDILYKEGQAPHGFYLIINGQIGISSLKQKQIKKQEIDNEEQQSKRNTIDVINVDLQILDKGAYFGQIQLLKKTPRRSTARCQSAIAEVYYLNKKNFFLIGYQTDLFYLLKQKIPLRQKHKQQQEQIALKIKSQSKFAKKQLTGKVDYSSLLPNPPQRKSTQSKINNHKESSESGTKYYHGYLISKMNDNKSDKTPYFSMLESNKQMYKQTVKKFRRFTKQPRIPYKPNVNWDMKRVWKILNLDDVLQEQSQLAQNKEGLQYFYKHQRLQNQIGQNRSLRPRTSSCSYQDKIKYVRYLDNFGRTYSRKHSQHVS